jgi:signal recognition particle GTPase
MLVNENIRPSGGVDGVGDNSSSDIMTLFSADMDENKRETIKGSAAFNAAQLIITEKRSDPEVIKSLRMFRPHAKKLTQINKKSSNSVHTAIKKKENNNVNENNVNGMPTKFAPMLSTLNLNPKIALRRVDEIDKKLATQQKKQQQVTAGDLSNELRNIQKTISFSTNKNPLTGFSKQKTLVKAFFIY